MKTCFFYIAYQNTVSEAIFFFVIEDLAHFFKSQFNVL